METEAEWQFVNTEVQHIKLPGFTPSEWDIGLKKQGDWNWVSGSALTISKWQKGEPSGDGDFVVMSKDSQGLFDDQPRDKSRPYICEFFKGKGEARWERHFFC